VFGSPTSAIFCRAARASHPTLDLSSLSLLGFAPTIVFSALFSGSLSSSSDRVASRGSLANDEQSIDLLHCRPLPFITLPGPAKQVGRRLIHHLSVPARYPHLLPRSVRPLFFTNPDPNMSLPVALILHSALLRLVVVESRLTDRSSSCSSASYADLTRSLHFKRL
jgi:hypothetical protein